MPQPAPRRYTLTLRHGFCPAQEVSAGARYQVSPQDDRWSTRDDSPPEIDITTAYQLRAVLLDTASRGHATVVVDLTLTRFCDCCGAACLLRAHQLPSADGGELVIPADGVVPRILAPTCLEEALAQASAAANRRRDARGPYAGQRLTRSQFANVFSQAGWVR